MTAMRHAALVVAEASSLDERLWGELARRFEHVRRVASTGEARPELGSPEVDLMLIDVDLPRGVALEVMQEALASRRLAPALAIGRRARSVDVFRLAQLGVRAYLPKPVEANVFARALDETLESAPDITPQLRMLVGRRPIQEVENVVRETMLREALCLSNGSRRGAARFAPRVAAARSAHAAAPRAGLSPSVRAATTIEPARTFAVVAPLHGPHIGSDLCNALRRSAER